MIKAENLTAPLEHIYTYVDDDGVNINIHAQRLRAWCLSNQTKLEVLLIPLVKSQAEKYIQNKTVSLSRISRFKAEHFNEPMIFCKDGTFTDGRPDVFHVDGHHRYVAQVLLGMPYGEAWVLELEQWQQFKIVGLSSVTQQQLIDMPILKRSY